MDGSVVAWLVAGPTLSVFALRATRFGPGRALGTFLAAVVGGLGFAFVGGSLGGHGGPEAAWAGFVVGGVTGIALAQVAARQPRCITGWIAAAVLLAGFVPLSGAFTVRSLGEGLTLLATGALLAVAVYALVERAVHRR
jgi:hypothetical protein